MSSSVTITGNVTREPELKYTPSGQAVVKFGVAVNRYYQGRGGEKVEETDFVDVTAWRELAENIAESLSTGARVVVSGRLKQDRWENEGGDKRSKLYVVADEVAASMRFATLSITKTTRGGNGSSWEQEQAPDPSEEEAERAEPATAKGKGKAEAASK